MLPTPTYGPLFYTISISSCSSELERVDVFVRKVLRKHDFRESELEDIVLAVHEGVTNAIAHGNRHCVSAPVQIFIRLGRKGVRIAIRDYGRGFDIRRVPDPTTNGNPEQPHGRGLIFIRHLMDDFHFTRTSMCHQLVMTKFRAT